MDGRGNVKVDMAGDSLVRSRSGLAALSEVIGSVLCVLVVLVVVLADLYVLRSDTLDGDERLAFVLLSVPFGVAAAFLTSFFWFVLARFLKLQERRDDQMRQLLAEVARLPGRDDLREALGRHHQAPGRSDREG